MELNYDLARETLKALADERPDYVHTNDPKLAESRDALDSVSDCLYRFVDDTPGCIVGALAARLFPGIRLKEGMVASAALRRVGVDVTRGAGNLLDSVQNLQDAGDTWAVAVRNGRNA